MVGLDGKGWLDPDGEVRATIRRRPMSSEPRSGLSGSTVSLSLAMQALRAAVQFVTTLKNRRAVASLAMLDDRALKDIGLTRNDVSAAMARPLHHDPSEHLAEITGGGRMRNAVGIDRRLDRTRHADAPLASNTPAQLRHA
jgi:uncharacterized protein YjiS (DUF1127 family)